MRKYLQIFVLVLLICSCSKNSFEIVIKPHQVRSTEIGQISSYNINGIVVSEDLIVINDWTSEMGIFKVYDYFPVSHLGQFGRKGKGPYEYISPFICKSIIYDNNSFELNIIDLNRKAKSQYMINQTSKDSTLVIPKDFGDISSSVFPSISFQENDNIIVVSPVGLSKGLFYIYDKEEAVRKWVDFYPKTQLRKGYDFIFSNKTIYNHQKKKIFCALKHFDHLLFYSENGELISCYNLGVNINPEFESDGFTLTDQTYYYSIDICSSPQYVYILWAGVTKRSYSNEDYDNSKVIVLDWDGNYIDCMEIPKSYLIAVNPQNTILFHVVMENEKTSPIRYIKLKLDDSL